MKPKVWTRLADTHVQSIWKCPNPECSHRSSPCLIRPGWYQNNGTPVCSDCDTDMEYKYTEILK